MQLNPLVYISPMKDVVETSLISHDSQPLDDCGLKIGKKWEQKAID